MDAWSLDMIFDNLPDSTTFPKINKYKKPDTDQTIVSSFSCSDKVITVGSYTNRNYYTNANFAITRDTTLHVGELSVFSSHGPTRDGRVKPDITATGEWVLSTGTQAEMSILSATEPEKVAAGKKHKRSSGTSMASPVVAGIAALFLQKNPTATWLEVKNAIINCADKDGFTGQNLPDYRWGNGKVNAYSSVRGCTIGITENQFSSIDLSIFPNPSAGNFSIQYDLSTIGMAKKAMLQISNILGQSIKTIELKDLASSVDMSIENMSSGVYFVSLKIDGKTRRTEKMIIL